MKRLGKLFGQRSMNKPGEARRRPARRSLRNETLEKRQLLAGDALPGHNYWMPEDVSGDWKVTPRDALLVLNHISRNRGDNSLDTMESGQLGYFPDVTGTNTVTPLDALTVLNRIRRGEGEAQEVLQLHLNPRTADNEPFSASAFNPDSRELTVQPGDPFLLEVLYSDLRQRGIFDPPLEGLFQIATDIVFDSDAIEPLLTETQIITFSSLTGVADGEFLIAFDDAPGETVSMGVLDFAQRRGAAIRDAIDALGRDDLGDVTVIRFDGLEYDVRFNDLGVANIDLPNLVITPQLVDGNGDPFEANVDVRDVPPVVNGALNPAAVPLNLNFNSRSISELREELAPGTTGPTQYFGTVGAPAGSFDAGVGLVGLGGTAPVLATGFDQGWPAVSTEIYGLPTDGSGNPPPLPDPFVAFTIPVRAAGGLTSEPVRVANNSLDGTGNFLFDGVNDENGNGGNGAIPGELIRIDDADGTGVIFVTTAEAQVEVSAGDGSLEAVQNGPDVTIDLQALVTVENGQGLPIEIELVDLPDASLGSLQVDAAGVATFSPTDQAGSTEFTYRATVAGVVSNLGTISVTVAEEQVVVVEAEDAQMPEAIRNGPPVTLDLRPSVTVSGGGEPTFELVSQDGPGTVEVSSEGIASYTPGGQTGVTSFIYRATANGVSDTGNVTVNVVAPQVNAEPGTLTAAQAGDAVTINLRNRVSVPGIPDAEPTIVITEQPVFGGATFDSATGLASYTPPADQFGQTSFQYSATFDGVTATATITVNVTEVEEEVTITADDAVLDADEGGQPVTINLLNLVEVTGTTNEPSLQITADPAFGQVSLNAATGVATYTPPSDQSGTTSFEYSATVNGQSATGVVTVNVAAAPEEVVVVAGDATRQAEEDGPAITIDLLDLVTVDGSDQTPLISLLNQPNLGTVSLDEATGVATYTPPADGFGSTSFDYQATVGDASDSGRITIEIAPIESPPIARDVNFNVVANTPTSFTSAQLTANDSPAQPNPSGDPPLVTAAAAIAGVTAGTVEFNAENNTVTYTPPADFTGQDRFEYTITSEGQTASAEVIINVQDFQGSTVSGSIFMDFIESRENPVRNGVRDSSEPAVGGVPVRLTSPASDNVLGESIDWTVWTNAEGEYAFGDVAPGNYTITFDSPETLIFGQRVDSDGVATGGSGRSFTVTVGPEGGAQLDGLNFTVWGRRGAAAGTGSILVSDYLRFNPNAPGNVDDPTFGLATMILDTDSGQQQTFELSEGFDGVLFAQIALSRSRDTAILTVVREDLTAQTFALSRTDGDFAVSTNGAVVRVLRNIDSMTPLGSLDEALEQEFGQYREAVDRVLAQFGIDPLF